MERQEHDSAVGNSDRLLKKEYSSPRLSDFGSVETLSLTGTRAGKEGRGVGNVKKKAGG